jgi:ethanolamine utilization cobalamin adenosyltransferase
MHLAHHLGYFESVDEFEMCRDINTTLKTLRNVTRSTKLSKAISGSAIAS